MPTGTTIIAATNLIPNPKFNANLTGWTYGASAGVTGTAAWDNTQIWTGAGDTKIAITASTGAANSYASLAISASRMPVTAGLNYVIAAIVYVPASTWGVVFSISWYNVGGSVISTYTDTNPTFPQLTASATNLITMAAQLAPALAVTAVIEIRFVAQNANQIGTVFLQAADFRQADVYDTYVDGDQGALYSWTGTANASASVRSMTVSAVQYGKGGVIQLVPQLFLADRNNVIGDDISSYVNAGSVTASLDQAIPKTFQATLRETNIVSSYLDYVAPFLTVKFGDGTVWSSQVGLYLVPQYNQEWTDGTKRFNFSCRDLTSLLALDRVNDTYVVSVGTDYIATVLKLVASIGITKNRVSIPPSTKLVPFEFQFDANTPKLDIVNHLLEGAGYYPIWMDNKGVLRSHAVVGLSQRTPAITYADGDGSYVTGKYTVNGDQYPVYNRVTVIASHPKGGRTTVVITNTNPSSPSSTVALNGLVMSRPALRDSHIPDTQTATDIASRLLEESSAMQVRGNLQTIPDPRRELHEVYTMNLRQNDRTRVAIGTYWARGWTMPFTAADGAMSHDLAKVIPFR